MLPYTYSNNLKPHIFLIIFFRSEILVEKGVGKMILSSTLSMADCSGGADGVRDCCV